MSGHSQPSSLTDNDAERSDSEHHQRIVVAKMKADLLHGKCFTHSRVPFARSSNDGKVRKVPDPLVAVVAVHDSDNAQSLCLLVTFQ